MWLCLAALLLLSFFFFAAAGTHTCDVAREGGTIDLAYLMLRSTHPMSHSAKQVNSFAGESPKTAVAAPQKKDIIALVTGPEAETLLIHVRRGLAKREKKGDMSFLVHHTL